MVTLVAASIVFFGCEEDVAVEVEGVACGPYTVSVDREAQTIDIAGIGSLNYGQMVPFRPATADARIGDHEIRLANMVWQGGDLAAFDITIDNTHSCHWPG